MTLNIKEVRADRTYYTVRDPAGGMWDGTDFTVHEWEAFYYDSKEEAEGGIILAVCKRPDLMGLMEVHPFVCGVTTMRGPDRKLLREKNEEGLQGR